MDSYYAHLVKQELNTIYNTCSGKIYSEFKNEMSEAHKVETEQWKLFVSLITWKFPKPTRKLKKNSKYFTIS